MGKDSLLFIILLAITVATVAAMLVQLLFSFMDRKKRALQQRLSAGKGEDLETAYGPIASAAGENVPDSLSEVEVLRGFSKRLKRAFPDLIMARFFVLVFGIAGLAFFAAYLGMDSVTAGLIVAGVAAVIPFVVVNAHCANKLRVLDDQLPEALDFISRVLRAGHSLTTGFQMGADELPDPLASEFRECYDHHSLGTPLEDAMKEMANRVGTSDFAFFVTAVMIQRQTGGDLAEVLTNIGNMIRARIRLQQHVKAITAQGRLVGYILLVLPVIFFCILYFVNPRYAGVLLNTREGSFALGVAVIFQVLGMLSIRKIVDVKM